MATPNIVPRSDSEGGLGTASKYWASAYIDLIYVGAGKMGRDADNLLDFSTDNRITFVAQGSNKLILNSSTLKPATNDGITLGNSGTGWSDLYLASGAVINFDDGNATITHSNNRLKINDNTQLALGDGQDLKIYHDSSNTYIDNSTGTFSITQSVADGDLALKADNGSGSPTPYLTLDGGNTRVNVEAVNGMQFGDNVRIKVGSGTGGDMRIYHDGATNVIEASSGNLQLLQHQNDGDIIFTSDDGSGGVTEYLRLDGGAAITVVSREMRFGDNVPLKFGGGPDLQLQHNGADSQVTNYTGDLQFANAADDKDISFASDNGAGATATYFYLDGSSATHDGSATTGLFTNWPDYSRISMGSSHDLQIYHDSTNSNIINAVGNLAIQNNADDGDIKFFCDDGSGGGAEYFRLDGGLVNTVVLKDFRFEDNVKGTFGSSQDLQIYHTGTQSLFTNTLGNLRFINYADDSDITFESDDGSGGTTAYLTLDGTNVRTLVKKNLNVEDDVQLQIGNSQDLKLYHNSSHSYIAQAGTGNLYIQNEVDDSDIIFMSDDGSGGVTEYFRLDGSVGHATFPDSQKLYFGSGHDAYLEHDGSNTTFANATGNLKFKNNTDDGDIVFECDDGSGGTATYVIIDGGATKTLFYKNTEHQDNIKGQFGESGDLNIYHDGTDSLIVNDTGDLYIRNNVDDKDIIFQSDNGSGGTADYIRIDGSATRIDISKYMRFADNVEAVFGGSSDLQIYHNATDSILLNSTGDLYIANGANDKDVIFQCDDGSDALTTYLQLDGSEVSTKILTQKVIMSNLPTSDPTNAGQLWNDSGTLKISAG